MAFPRPVKTMRLLLAMPVLLLPLFAGADSRPASTWRNTLTAAYAWQGDSDLDGGGRFRVDRGVVQFKSTTRLGPRWFAGFSVGYGEVPQRQPELQ